MPPTPPSSHGSDSEGSQSPVHAPPGLSCPPSPGSPGGSPAPSPGPSETPTKASTRAPSSLSNSPLLTAPHVSETVMRGGQPGWVELWQGVALCLGRGTTSVIGRRGQDFG